MDIKGIISKGVNNLPYHNIMKSQPTVIIATYFYNGLFLALTPIAKPIPCTVIGVRVPCDPGFVVVEADGVKMDVPTICLRPSPKINFERLLTIKQKAKREKHGALIAGLNDQPGELIKPIEMIKE